MDLSYTDPSFHPIYSLRGISQSVLEVTIEIKQKKLFNYYYLFQELWKATSFNLCKRDDVFEPPYYFHFFFLTLHLLLFINLLLYYLLIFHLSTSINILFLLNWAGRQFFRRTVLLLLSLLLFLFLWRCFCFVLFFCLFVYFGLSRWHPFFVKCCLNSLKRLPERVRLTWAS